MKMMKKKNLTMPSTRTVKNAAPSDALLFTAGYGRRYRAQTGSGLTVGY